MKVTIEGRELVIRAPISDALSVSMSGKIKLLVDTMGFYKVPGLSYEGKQVSVSINAIIPIK